MIIYNTVLTIIILCFVSYGIREHYIQYKNKPKPWVLDTSFITQETINRFMSYKSLNYHNDFVDKKSQRIKEDLHLMILGMQTRNYDNVSKVSDHTLDYSQGDTDFSIWIANDISNRKLYGVYHAGKKLDKDELRRLNRLLNHETQILIDEYSRNAKQNFSLRNKARLSYGSTF